MTNSETMTNYDNSKSLGYLNSLLPIKREILCELNGGTFCLRNVDSSKLNAKLMGQICNSAINGFGFDMDISDIQDHVKKSDENLFIIHNGKIIGFTSFTNMNGSVPYLYGAVIDSKYHGLGIQTLVNAQIFNHIGELFFRTQNRGLIKSFKKLGFDVHIGEAAYRVLDERFTQEEKQEYFGNILIWTANI